MKKKKSIFRRIVLNVLIPEILVFIIIAISSSITLMDLMIENRKDKTNMIINELVGFHEFQDQSLDILKKLTAIKAEKLSNLIKEGYQSGAYDVESVSIDSLVTAIGLSNDMVDLYIINDNGIVVNTTYKTDLFLDFFAFGDEHKNYIIQAFSNSITIENFVLERFTKKFKLFTYVPTHDKKYLIQLHIYSEESDVFSERIKAQIDKIEENPLVDTLEFILKMGYPTSLYNDSEWNFDEEDSILTTDKYFEYTIIKEVMGTNEPMTYEANDKMYYYKPIKEGESLIRVVYDLETYDELRRKELLKSMFIFFIGILLLFSLLLFNVRRITRPLKKLQNAALDIANGNLAIQVDVKGKDEVAELSHTFNQMANDLLETREELDTEKKIVEEKNKEIIDSINYAKRIQSAILPPDQLIKKSLPKSFIYYQPKDIVAGDFYWFSEVEDITYFAVADCTGHGVPGAIVSVLCNNALNRSVNEFKLVDVGEILDKTKALLNQEFEKSEEEVNDGMDIALCALKGNQLFYAGAYNPLWIIRANELIEIKADKQPIGKYFKEQLFTSHTVELESGDAIYIFSDGYVDQFGGEKGKKLKSKAFKELLFSMQSMSMVEQEQKIKQGFEEWRGEYEQVDDVCVMGVKVG